MHKRTTHVEFTLKYEPLPPKKRVAAYARVSSEKDEATHSLSAQISYFNGLIAAHPDWEFVEIFADQGLTGTKENRPEFQRMLTACREGKIDVILAKSITRFARNTVTLLETVRELKGLGIDVYFEEQRLHTLSSIGELLLTALAAQAQEESRIASENQKWRIRRKYEKGEPVTGNALGYRLVDGTFWIDEEEEQTVKRIFCMYLSGMGRIAIAKKLNEEGVSTRLGKAKWHPSSIYTILTNEKYRGDLQLQKTYITDYISKKQEKNHGKRPVYQVRNAHDAIVDRNEFSEVQEERNRRAAKYYANPCTNRYPFTGLIRCGKCSHNFRRRIMNAGTKYAKPGWECGTYLTFGKEHCDAQQIPEDILTAETRKVLGVEELTEEILHEQIIEIVIPEKNVMIYRFRDGSEQRVEWQNRSRRDSWTPDMRERARQQTKKRLEGKKKC